MRVGSTNPDVTNEDGCAEVARIAKALGHPARVRIVELLVQRRACIGCEVVEEVGLAQSTVSEHLRILKAAGIITGEIEGPRVCYSLNPASVEALAELLHMIAQAAASSPVPSACAAPPTAPSPRTAR